MASRTPLPSLAALLLSSFSMVSVLPAAVGIHMGLPSAVNQPESGCRIRAAGAGYGGVTCYLASFVEAGPFPRPQGTSQAHGL